MSELDRTPEVARSLGYIDHAAIHLGGAAASLELCVEAGVQPKPDEVMTIEAGLGQLNDLAQRIRAALQASHGDAPQPVRRPTGSAPEGIMVFDEEQLQAHNIRVGEPQHTMSLLAADEIEIDGERYRFELSKGGGKRGPSGRESRAGLNARVLGGLIKTLVQERRPEISPADLARAIGEDSSEGLGRTFDAMVERMELHSIAHFPFERDGLARGTRYHLRDGWHFFDRRKSPGGNSEAVARPTEQPAAEAVAHQPGDGVVDPEPPDDVGGSEFPEPVELPSEPIPYEQLPSVVASDVDKAIWYALAANAGLLLAPRALAQQIRGFDQKTLKQTIPRFFDRLLHDPVFGKFCLLEKEDERKAYGILAGVIALPEPSVEQPAAEDASSALPGGSQASGDTDAVPPGVQNDSADTAISGSDTIQPLDENRRPTPYTQLNETEAALYKYFRENRGVTIRQHEIWTYVQDVGLNIQDLSALETMVAKLAKDPLLADSFQVNGSGSKATYCFTGDGAPDAATKVSRGEGNGMGTSPEEDTHQTPRKQGPTRAAAAAAAEVQRGRQTDGAEATQAVYEAIIDGAVTSQDPASAPLLAMRRALSAVSPEDLEDPETHARYKEWQSVYKERTVRSV